MEMPSVGWVFMATAQRVLDGDTIQVEVDLGMRVYSRQIVRLVGPGGKYFDAPESRGAKASDAGRAAKDYLAQLLPPGTPLVIQTFKDPQDK